MSSSSASRPPTIDPVAARRWARQAPGDAAPWLHEEVGRRMEERLQWIKATPRHWADWSPLRGGLEVHERVAQRYPQAAAYVQEPEPALHALTTAAFAAPWWSAKRWRGGRPQLLGALPEGGVDLLWANMGLHMAPDPEVLIAEWHRRVATDGFLMFSGLGPDTLMELRSAYRVRGWPEPAHAFTDMHDWGDMLVHAGFAEPVMDMERIVLTWGTPEAALAELRTLGRNLHRDRFPALRGRRWRAQMLDLLAGLASDEHGGRIALTFEIIYGHAFKPVSRVAVAPESAIGLNDMRQMLRRGRDGA
ncbi:biotin synthase [uncultured Pseudacidovorax sp.]|uniref:biotin synthase n=1 Tax=uncultured Pseudacidovorax sp. TaxID=679313 RepID=UPI0025F751FA|nr:biotin synthase [uncultured Pseudacidovorax sp.]